MRTSLLGGASPFAHLAGIGLGRRRAEQDDDGKEGRRARRAEADDDDKDDDGKQGRRARAEDDDKDDDGKEGRRARRAEGEDDDKDDDGKQGRRARAEDDDKDDDGKESRRARRAEEDEDEEDEPRGRRSRRARAEDDDDDDDDKNEMSGRSAAASARRRERARCAAIFASPYAAENIAMAASLAFETTMTRQEALAVLKSQAGRGPAPGDRPDRADRNARLAPGGGSTQPTHEAIQTSWDRAIAKAVPGQRK